MESSSTSHELFRGSWSSATDPIRKQRMAIMITEAVADAEVLADAVTANGSTHAST